MFKSFSDLRYNTGPETEMKHLRFSLPYALFNKAVSKF